MDKSGANKAAIDAINAGRDVPIVVRQVKYLNNIVEQDHRAIKQVTSPMLNFKSFRAAHCVLAGVELMHMIRKGQFAINGTDAMSFADQFYALAAQVRPVEAPQFLSWKIPTSDQQRDTTPDFSVLALFPKRGVVVTAPGRDYDFVSRWFGPRVGVNEDPVTGSAHTWLAPYWTKRLGKPVLKARQGGVRTGTIVCEMIGTRVILSGNATRYLRGEINF